MRNLSFSECNPTQRKIPLGIPALQSYPSSQQKKPGKPKKLPQGIWMTWRNPSWCQPSVTVPYVPWRPFLVFFFGWSFHMFGDFPQNPRGFCLWKALKRILEDLDGGFKHFWIFYPGNDPIWLICFKWVGSTCQLEDDFKRWLPHKKGAKVFM